MKNYDLYLFDFDGTLFDSYESLIPIYGKAFSEYGESCSPEEVAIYMHMSISETCEKKKIKKETAWKIARRIIEMLDDPLYFPLIKDYADVIPTLSALQKEGKSIALVSGNTESHINSVLQLRNLEDYFSCVVGGNADRRPKPAPDPIFAALKEFPSISKDKAVYIGDSLQDVLCAHNAGIDGILLERNHEYGDFLETKISSLEGLVSDE